ncbi:MAG: GNAT family N-acetyltransferase, partial [Alphaproteobacteria bacterium]|nr:GNAT family N-acetyltransferase [Alphaproteobacteria bacterium]
MSEIRILPIFNQSAPGVWDDMLRIRIATMRHNYNIKLTDQEISEAMAEFQQSWKRLSFNFAFGAYDDGKMVGCISGDVQNKTAFIRHLYVLPEYQGQRIGSRLLNEAEIATSVSARQTDIVALA